MSNNKSSESKIQMNKLVAVVAATAVSLGTVVSMDTAAFATTETPTVNETSGLLGATLSPAVPTGLTVAAGNGTITANWVANVDGSDSYKVQYSTSSTFAAASTVTVTSTDNSEVVTGLKPLTTYYVKVAGVSAGVTGSYGAAVTAKTFGVASAPSSLRLTVGVKSLNATWVAPTVVNGSPVSKYVVQYSTDSTFATNVSTVESVDAVEALTGLNDSSKYYVRVASVNAVGQGVFTSAVAATTAALPSAAQTVAASSAAGSSTVTWKAPASNGGIAITSYRVEYSKDASFATIAGSVKAAYNATSAIVKPIDPSTQYYYRVFAVNALGEAPASNVATATSFAVASAPATITTTPGVASGVVKWTAPTSNGGSPVTGYNVEYSTNADFSGSKTIAATSTTVSATLSTLTAGSTYYVRVAAKTLAGVGVFTPTSSFKVHSAPTAPATSTVTGGNLNFVAKWTAPASNGGTAVTGYTLEYATLADFSNKKVVSLGATTLTSTVASLTSGATYYVRVAGKNAAGTGAFSEVYTVNTNKAAEAPATVTLKTAVGTTGPTVTPSWTASPNLNGQVLTNYSVQYSTDASFAAANTKTVLTKSLTTAISGLQSDATYYVRVATMTAAGTSVYTAPVNVKTVAAAKIPVNVTANATAAKTVVVDVPVVAGVTKTTVQASLASTFSSPITVTAVNGKATFSTLAEGKTYYFRAQDTNSVGASSYSATVSKATIAAPVTNVASSNVGADSATVSWTASAAGATSYNVYSDGVLVANVPSTVLSYSFTGLNEGTVYKLSVAAVNVSGLSAAVETTVTTGVLAPKAIVEASVSNVTDSSVDVSWTLASSFVDGYNVYKNGVLVAQVGKDVTSYSFTGLTDATSYAFSVAPYNTAGQGVASHVTATTVDSVAPVAGLSGVSMFDANGDQYAHIAWTANSEAANYIVYKNGAMLTSVDKSVLSFDAGLNVAESAVFSVVAVKADGVTKSAAASVSVTASAVYEVGNIKVDSVGQNSADISWNVQPGAVKYYVYVGGVKVDEVSSASAHVAGLNVGSNNVVGVAAVYADGVSKAAAVDVQTLGDVSPTVNVVSSVPDAVDIAWVSAEGVQKYEIVNSSGVVIGEVSNSGLGVQNLNYIIKSLKADTSYNFTVRAVFSDGSDSTSVALKTAALTNVNVQVVNRGYTSANISWTEAPGASGYKLSTMWSGDVVIPAGATSYTVNGLTPGGMMTQYSLTPLYSFGSGMSSSFYLSGQMLPNPQNWTGASNSTTSATLSWSEPSAEGVTLQAHEVFLNGMYVATVPAGTTSYMFTGLKASTTYFMSVNSVYNVGNSGQAGMEVKTAAYDTYPVASVDTYAVNATSVNVGWKRIFGDPNLVSYTIKMNGVKLIDIDPESSFYVVKGLQSNTSYTFSVTANYVSSVSTEVYSTVATPPTFAEVVGSRIVDPSAIYHGEDVWTVNTPYIFLEEVGNKYYYHIANVPAPYGETITDSGEVWKIYVDGYALKWVSIKDGVETLKGTWYKLDVNNSIIPVI